MKEQARHSNETTKKSLPQQETIFEEEDTTPQGTAADPLNTERQRQEQADHPSDTAENPARLGNRGAERQVAINITVVTSFYKPYMERFPRQQDNNQRPSFLTEQSSTEFALETITEAIKEVMDSRIVKIAKDISVYRPSYAQIAKRENVSDLIVKHQQIQNREFTLMAAPANNEPTSTIIQAISKDIKKIRDRGTKIKISKMFSTRSAVIIKLPNMTEMNSLHEELNKSEELKTISKILFQSKEIQQWWEWPVELSKIYDIEISDKAEPKMSPARRLPRTLFQPVKEELFKMEEDWIIEKIEEPTVWAHPMVVDRHTRPADLLSINDRVWFQKDKRWIPGQITNQAHEPRSFYVKDQEGNEYRRNIIHIRKDKRNETAHTDWKKPLKLSQELANIQNQEDFTSQESTQLPSLSSGQISSPRCPKNLTTGSPRNWPTGSPKNWTNGSPKNLISTRSVRTWKYAIIITIPKKSPVKSPEDLRPISLLSTIGKVYERIVLRRLQTYMDSINFIIPQQFGFRKGHSTTHQLITVIDYIQIRKSHKEAVGAVFLDFTKAFDRVWHDGLIAKITKNQFPRDFIKLLKNYLQDRTFSIEQGNYITTAKPTQIGVPQGSILGPYLFKIYINYFPPHPKCQIKLFADDAAILANSKSIGRSYLRLPLSKSCCVTMAAISATTAVVEKLNGQNYRSWKYNIKMLLIEKGLWDVMIKDEDTQDAQLKAQKDRALAFIALSINTEHQIHIIDCTSPQDAWKNLEQVFEPKSRSKILQLKKQFVNIKLQTGELMLDYLNRLEICTEHLKEAGAEVDDQDIAYSMLSGLPDSFDTLVMSFGNVEDSDFTSNKVRNTLLTEYERRSAREGASSGLSEALNFSKDDTRKTSRKQGVKSSIKRDYKADKSYSRKKDSFKSPSENMLKAFNAVSSEDEFILDSGATHHVYCGGNLQVEGVGNIHMKMYLDTGTQDVTLNDVLFVPQARRNLLSVSQTEDKGKHIKICNHKARVFSDNRVICVARNLNGLYIVRDDFSHRVIVYFLKHKDQVIEYFDILRARPERETGHKIKRLRTDNGPQQNGVSERLNRSLLDMARASMHNADLPQKFWAESVNCAAYIKNRSLCSALDNKVPEEIWLSRKVSLRHLKIFGALAYAHIPKQKRKKFDRRAKRCILVGYSTQSKGYRLWDNDSKQVFINKHARFDENKVGLNQLKDDVTEGSEAKNSFVWLPEQGKVLPPRDPDLQPGYDSQLEVPSTSEVRDIVGGSSDNTFSLRSREIERKTLNLANIELIYARCLNLKLLKKLFAHPNRIFGKMRCKKRKKHWEAAKHVLRYLSGTIDFELSYVKGNNNKVAMLTDADYGSDTVDRRSYSGMVAVIDGNVINWRSKKQQCVSLSIMESESLKLWRRIIEGEVIEKSIETKDEKFEQKVKIWEDWDDDNAIARNVMNQTMNATKSLKYSSEKSAKRLHRRNLTPLIKKCYELYFGCKVGDQDKTWAPHHCCEICARRLTGWINVEYPDLPSAMRPVPHSDSLPVPQPPENVIFSNDDLDRRERQSDDTNFEAGASSEPHLLTQGDLNDLVRDLDLSK
ncbi:hypothetical protein LAZ67_12002923 [Cordylochernes scorpioides]|uniref:Reverse transcriptase domain-containing protein n=1 Tax=Cordylochernes scorpioides TaxID=51811 RepID=A0ABY6L240_9ARAC|nr:hypothetical protein LAZ67_12002923 [Cordylochernes scorpioides]